MAPERLTSSRARTTALAVAFSVVAGGAALIAVPQIATAVEEGAVAEGSITTESTSIPVSGSGFTPGNIVYAQVKLPDGTTNWSWNSTPFTAAEDGTVTGELTSADGFAAGVYEITLFESDDISQTTTIEVQEAGEDDGSTTPTLTGEPSESAPAGEVDDEANADADADEADDDADADSTEADAGSEGDADAGVEGDAAEADVDGGVDDAGAEGDVDGAVPPAESGEADAAGDELPDTEAPVTEARAWAEQDRYTADEASTAGITYYLEGFTPGVELNLVLTLPSGEQAEFASNEPIVPGADGTYVGTITYTGAWPAGDYSVTLRTADGATIPVDITPPAETGAPGETGPVDGPSEDTTDDDTAGDDATGEDSAGDDVTRSIDSALSAVQPAPVQEASFTFAVEGAQTGGGSGGTGDKGATGAGGSASDDGLASTGGEIAFGAAGLGLVVLGAGAIVLITGRFLGRRRDV